MFLETTHFGGDRAPLAIRRPTRVAALVAIAAIALGGAAIYGETWRAAAERDKGIATAEEDRAVCAGLGFTPASEAYISCAEALAAVRRRAEVRLTAQAGGLL